jgi:negative regulator of genetic competence, sporulation and motility
LEVFSVEMKSNDMKKVSEYVLRRVNKKVLKDGFALAVSNKGFHFVDNQRQLIYITFQFTDFDEIISHSDQLTIWLEDRNLSITFQTNDGYFILSLLQDYQYLEVEL